MCRKSGEKQDTGFQRHGRGGESNMTYDSFDTLKFFFFVMSIWVTDLYDIRYIKSSPNSSIREAGPDQKSDRQTCFDQKWRYCTRRSDFFRTNSPF